MRSRYDDFKEQERQGTAAVRQVARAAECGLVFLVGASFGAVVAKPLSLYTPARMAVGVAAALAACAVHQGRKNIGEPCP